MLIKLLLYADHCPQLDNPVNGEISCKLQNGRIPLSEDTCSFTCDTGYELTGSSDTRTCQSDTSWSGSDAICSKGKQLLVCIQNYWLQLTRVSSGILIAFSVHM